jgi:hypothetical protein
MMGVVVGKAASIAVRRDSGPRGVYEEHLGELISLMKLPGNMRRDSLEGPFYEDPSLPKLMPAEFEYHDPSQIGGIVIDDTAAKLEGKWAGGSGLKSYIGDEYKYAGRGREASARFEFKVPKAGRYEVRVSHQHHENRASNALFTVEGTAGGPKGFRINQKEKAPLKYGMTSLGIFEFDPGRPSAVVVSTEDADGTTGIDAVQVVEAR